MVALGVLFVFFTADVCFESLQAKALFVESAKYLTGWIDETERAIQRP